MAKQKESVQIPPDHCRYCILLLSLLNRLQGRLGCLSFRAQTPKMLETEEISSSRHPQFSKILQQSKKSGGADSTLSIRTCACPILGLQHIAAVAAVTLVGPREEPWRHPWLRGQHFGVTSMAPALKPRARQEPLTYTTLRLLSVCPQQARASPAAQSIHPSGSSHLAGR